MAWLDKLREVKKADEFKRYGPGGLILRAIMLRIFSTLETGEDPFEILEPFKWALIEYGGLSESELQRDEKDIKFPSAGLQLEFKNTDGNDVLFNIMNINQNYCMNLTPDKWDEVQSCVELQIVKLMDSKMYTLGEVALKRLDLMAEAFPNFSKILAETSKPLSKDHFVELYVELTGVNDIQLFKTMHERRETNLFDDIFDDPSAISKVKK